MAAWYVNDILAAAPAPPGMLPAEVKRSRPLAFKTGTSYGFRDAWAIGYDRDVTIAVWAGRPDGTPMPGRSGRVTAAPILFKIADLLGPSTDKLTAEPPAGALMVSRRDLPAALRPLDPRQFDLDRKRDAAGPKILYPPDGAAGRRGGRGGPLESAGGPGAFRWA